MIDKAICRKAESLLAGMVNPAKYVLGYKSVDPGPFTGARFYFSSGHGVGAPALGGGHRMSGPLFVPGSDIREPTSADVTLAKRIISDAAASASSREAKLDLRENAWRGFQEAFQGIPYRIGKAVWLGLEIEIPRDNRGQPEPRKTRVTWRGKKLHCYSDPEKVMQFLKESNIPLRKEISFSLSAYHSGYASREQVDFLNLFDVFIKEDLGLDEEAEKSF